LHFAIYLKYPDLLSVYNDYVFEIFENLPFIDKSIVMFHVYEYATKRLESYGFSLEDPNFFHYLGEHGSRFRKIVIPDYQQIMRSCCIPQLLNKPFLFQDFDFIKRLLMHFTPLESIINDFDMCCYPEHVLSRIR
jgi:hypothetical protein